MNVTKQKYKGRKFHNENCPQKVAAEQREYAGVPRSVRIAETRDIIADLPANKEIARQGYMTMTSYYKQVCEN